MLIAPEIVSIPISLLTHYHHFISDKEFLVILHLQGIATSGKASFETVAERLEYKSIKGVNNAVKNMVERGVVKYGNNKYVVDANPLYASCQDMQEKVEVELAKPKEKKVKEVRVEYGIAAGIVKEFNELQVHKSTLHQIASSMKGYLDLGMSEEDVFDLFLWSYRYQTLISDGVNARNNAIKPFIGTNTPEEDFKAFLYYAESLTNRHMKKGELRNKVFCNKITLENYGIWSDLGKPERYEKKPKIDYSDI